MQHDYHTCPLIEYLFRGYVLERMLNPWARDKSATFLKCPRSLSPSTEYTQVPYINK